MLKKCFIQFQAEIRTLEFWRSIIAECVATFFYVVIVCSVTTSSTEHTVQINTAIASGLAAAMLTSAFARVSGAHLNPAVTAAMMFTRQLSPLRAILYICAQCGGGIAGAALVLGVYARVNDPALQTGGGAFGMEFVLTFLVVYAYCASRTENRPPLMAYAPVGYSATGYTTAGYSTATTYGTPIANTPGVKPDPVSVGMAYAGCMIAWKGSLNPARALGSAFVSKNAGRFDQHWVFWVGPLLGAITGAFAYEYIFNPRRKAPFNFGSNYNATTGAAIPTATAINGVGMIQPTHNTIIGTGGMPMRHHPDEQMSICEDEIDMLDDLERAKQQHYKSNIMQDFNERNSTYSSSALMRSQQGGYGKNNYRQNYGDATMYGDPKGMYGHPMNTSGGVGNYDAKSMYDGYGSKSCYNGYDGVNTQQPRPGGMPGASLRRSRSIHESAVVGGTPSQQQRGLAAAQRRRNPYDYLPDEPHMTSNVVPSTAAVPGATNKPDIMQSVDGRLDSSADNGRAMMNRFVLIVCQPKIKK